MADSTVLRFIDELNGVTDADYKYKRLCSEIRALGRLPSSDDIIQRVKLLNLEKKKLQFKPDYFLFVSDRNADYRYAAENGFTVNGVRYKRLLATTGGIKMSTIVFVNEALWAELRRRLDNGRDLNKELVPAKFGAYEALACSAATPVSMPDGILVVPDCITHFTERAMVLDGSKTVEPMLTEVENYLIDKDASDGFGTMTPARAAIWSAELGLDYVMSGCNSRLAFEKGMLVTFDHIAFVEKYNNASDDNPSGYFVKDVWGHEKDVRNVDVIFTESMLKLWDSYSSIEDYLSNCEENHYQLAIPKVAPEELDDQWSLNYQFIQSYDLTDDEIVELAEPTMLYLEDSLGGDYRKMLLYLCGVHGFNRKSFFDYDNYAAQAIMCNPQAAKDPMILSMVKNMINKRINDAKIGVLDVHGHFQIACGDPFALWQSICGLEVTGLLKAGQVYSQYWSADEPRDVAVFRAPMTVNANIKRMTAVHDDDMDYWYQYIKTMLILNVWDSSTDAMNGEDFDGDQNFITDNYILVNNIRGDPTTFCLQRKAKKSLFTEHDLVESNILSFGSQIGKITNGITSQFDVLSRFDKNELEADILRYRIACGQDQQQAEIDKAKGIITKPRPASWFNYHENRIKEDDTASTIFHKTVNKKIVADKKPYFMIYRYRSLRQEYQKIFQLADIKSNALFSVGITDLLNKPAWSEAEEEFVRSYLKQIPVTLDHSVMNKICHLVERRFANWKVKDESSNFDYRIYKSDADYHDPVLEKRLTGIYLNYREAVQRVKVRAEINEANENPYDGDIAVINNEYFEKCMEVCPDIRCLTDLLLNICYSSQKSRIFVWALCGDQIIDNMLERCCNIVSIPRLDESGDFLYNGKLWKMVSMIINESGGMVE